MSGTFDRADKLVMVAGLGVFFLLAGYVLAHAHEDIIPPPPEQGTSVTLGGLYIVCDTKDQVADIITGGGHDNKALEAKFHEYNAKIDTKGEPTCDVAQVGRVVVGESEMLGVNMSADGREVNSWAVHIGNEQGEWWMLYGVPTVQGDPA